MKIVVLDGYTENPGDLSWAGLEALGSLTVYDRTSFTEGTEEILRRAEGAEITTIEGVAKSPTEPHPIQEEFIEQGAIQCGFCTPGMIMSTKALLDKNSDPTVEEVREALGGNLCRCTGYVNIEKAVFAAAERMRKEGSR